MRRKRLRLWHNEQTKVNEFFLIKLIGLYEKMLGIRVSPCMLYMVHSFNETASITVSGIESFFPVL